MFWSKVLEVMPLEAGQGAIVAKVFHNFLP